MANRRMFNARVVETDSFLELPTSSQALYFHLGMAGDDDGFVDSPRKIVRSCGCEMEDLRKLEESGFVIEFGSGIIVIRDWKLNNTLQNDRYRPTLYADEKDMIEERGKRYFLKK